MRVRQNLRRAYDTGRESVRISRLEQDGNSGSELEEDFEPPPPEPMVDHQSTASRDDAEVPHSLRIAASWAVGASQETYIAPSESPGSTLK